MWQGQHVASMIAQVACGLPLDGAGDTCVPMASSCDDFWPHGQQCKCIEKAAGSLLPF